MVAILGQLNLFSAVKTRNYKRIEKCQSPSHLVTRVGALRAVPGKDSSSTWRTVRGEFVAVNAFMISCRCRYALEGPAPAAHLGDGCTDLVLVHRCSRYDYIRHLYRCSDPSKDQVCGQGTGAAFWSVGGGCFMRRAVWHL